MFFENNLPIGYDAPESTILYIVFCIMFLAGIGYLIVVNLEIRKIRKSYKEMPSKIYMSNNQDIIERID